MNSGIRIIKRERDGGLTSSPRDQDEKSGRQNEREMASTVKGWIAEVAQRRLTDKQIACTRFFSIH